MNTESTNSRKTIVAFSVVIILMAATIAIVSCGQKSNSPGPLSTQKIKILLDWKSEPTYAGFFIAREKGYFDDLKKQGFEVEIVEGNGAATVAQIMGTSDEYLVASCSGEATAIAVSKGIPIKSLAVLYPNVPTVIYSREDTPIFKPADLVGKRIGLIDGSVTVDEYRGLLAANGVDRSMIQEVHVGWDVAPLLTKQVDGLMNYEELTPVELRLQGHNVVIMRFADYGLKAYSLNLIANKHGLASNPDTIRRIVVAVTRGYQFVKSNPEESAQIFSRLYPEKNKEYVRDSMKIVAKSLGNLPVGNQTSQGWEETIKTLGDLKLLAKDVTVPEIAAEGYSEK